MEFQRTNAFGEVVGKPTDSPASKIGQNNQRQVNVLFGHEGGGKTYTYLAGENVRTGDIVTPEVTHPKSGKDYKTLGRVMSTRDSEGGPAGDTAGYLSSKGIMLKTLGPTDQHSLPGFKAKEEQAKAQGEKFTTKQWASEAKKKYHDKVMRRLNAMGK